MKLKIDAGNLRSEYFQAVSNSSWANEGYLVAPYVATENEDFMNELTLLNNAFGIGVIRLDIEMPEESEILFYAKQRQNIDSKMLDKLIYRNDDVAKLFKCVLDSQELKRIVDEEKVFDRVYDDDGYKQYVREKNLLE